VHLAACSAAGAGVIAFTKASGREVAGRDIFVKCVAPGHLFALDVAALTAVL